MKTKTYLTSILYSCLLISLSLFTALPCRSQSPDFLWAKAMGGAGNNYGNSISLDAAGNIFTTGCFSGTTDFDPGPGTFTLASAGLNDIFIMKSDGMGNLLWARRIGGTNNEFSWSIANDPSGNILFTGYYNGTIDFDPGTGTANLTSAGYADIFVCKLDSYGNFMWAKSMGSSDNDDYGYSLDTDVSGNIYITGIFSGSADFDPSITGTSMLTSAGGPDIFISKLNSSGNFVWAKAIGGPDYENGFSIAVDGPGNVYATGYFSGTVDFNPGPAQTSFLTSAGSFDVYILKLNASGDFQWAKAMGGADDDFGSDLTFDGSGNVYSVGHFQGVADFDPGAGIASLNSAGSADIYISKLTNSGNFVWAKSFGGINYDDGFSIAVDGSGNVYSAGRFTGVVDFDPGTATHLLSAAGWGDIFISKLNSSGNFEWAKAAGGMNDDGCKSIAIDASGFLFLTGNFVSPSITFGATTLSNAAGAQAFFIAKLDNSITGLINQESENGIFIYPNPARDWFTTTVNGNCQHAEISIADMSGKNIPVAVITTLKGTSMEITVYLPENNLEAGIYFVRISTSEINETQKLVVVR